MIIRIATALLPAILFCFIPQAAHAADRAGEVLTLKGGCFVATGGGRKPLNTGDPVYVADIVQVPEGAKLKLRMVDGSVISAAGGTEVTITAYQAENGSVARNVELDLASGLLRAVVSTVSQPSRFEVDTAAGVAAVRGTDWFVRASSPGTVAATQVGVLRGKVSLTSRATDHAVTIPAHWGAKVEAGMDPVPPRVWQRAEFAAVIAATNVN